jgi:cAMP phosphodiesterase
VQEDEQLKKLVMINGAQKWSVVAEKIKVRQLLSILVTRSCARTFADQAPLLAHCAAGALGQELPSQVGISGAPALVW